MPQTDHAVDWESAIGGHVLTPTEKDLNGYLIVPTLVSDNKPTTLLKELLQEMNSHKGPTWAVTKDLQKEDGSVISEKVDLSFAESLCNPFNVLCNACRRKR